MSVALDREQGRTAIIALVQAYRNGRQAFLANDYKEAQLRADFLNPFLKALGWDVENEAHATQFYRTVLQEESIDVEEETGDTRKKNPDYTLRVDGKRELFVEAKKARINVSTAKPPAFQTRRYGWSAGLSASVLTNFEHLVIYDATFQPSAQDEAHVARYRSYSFEEYIDRFDEIYDTLSYEAVCAGSIKNLFQTKGHDRVSFDEAFLSQIQSWRQDLAHNIQQNNDLQPSQLNLLVQRIINRIVFLRICEDREIEKKDVLKEITTYDQLKELFVESDRRYNSGLFDFIEDELSLGITIDTDLLIAIFGQLYFPNSPYDFAVVDSAILSEIYEHFLSQRIEVSPDQGVQIVDDEQVVASNGVVPTPVHVVEAIVEETLKPLVQGKSLDELRSLRIGDICCGSGSFLIGVYQILLEAYTAAATQEGLDDPRLVAFDQSGILHLTLEAKKQIVLENIWGVDFNNYAVEVARFSLLLKVLENEDSHSIDHHIAVYSEKALPNLEGNIRSGNSLVGNDYFDFDERINEDEDLLYKIKPFDWSDEFPFMQDGGFDVIVGNPPYVRIQNLQQYFPEEVKYYRKSTPGYVTARERNIDKYYLFIEKALQLLKPVGLLGYIVPHKFFIIPAGLRLRSYIRENSSIASITHFGVVQVFPGKMTYTAILVLQKGARENFSFRRISDASQLSNISVVASSSYKNEEFSKAPWVFVSDSARAIFNKIRDAGTQELSNGIADIPVGLQTSADSIYIITEFTIQDDLISFVKEDVEWQIETDILRDCFYDVSFELFDRPAPNAKMIYPYELNEGSTSPIQEGDLEARFPLCMAYLNHHRAELEKRSISGGQKELQTWYQYGRSQSLSKFNDTEKLIWSVLAQDAPYGFDTSNALFTGGGNGPYYALTSTSEYSLFYLLGILSHPVIEAMVKAGASEFSGSYYSHGKQFIKKVPIKTIDFTDPSQKAIHDEIDSLVDNLIDGKRRITEMATVNRPLIARQRHLRRRLIRLVNNLYGITEEETQSIVDGGVFAVEMIEDHE